MSTLTPNGITLSTGIMITGDTGTASLTGTMDIDTIPVAMHGMNMKDTEVEVVIGAGIDKWYRQRILT